MWIFIQVLENDVLRLAEDALLSISFCEAEEEGITKLASSDYTKLENEVTNIDHIQKEKGTVGSIVS